jgi:hypothetical protein
MPRESSGVVPGARISAPFVPLHISGRLQDHRERSNGAQVALPAPETSVGAVNTTICIV